MEIIGALIIGAIAGWLGSKIFEGKGHGIIRNTVLGIVGSILGYYLFGLIGINIGSGWISSIIAGVTGAIIILFILNLFTRKK